MIRLEVLESGSFHRICIPVTEKNGEDYSQVLSFFDERSNQYGKNIDRLLAMFEVFANKGHKALSSRQFHLSNKPNKIYQFSSGDLRVHCFAVDGDLSFAVDGDLSFAVDGDLIVLACGVLKKGQKADKSAVETAKRLKKLIESEGYTIEE